MKKHIILACLFVAIIGAIYFNVNVAAGSGTKAIPETKKQDKTKTLLISAAGDCVLGGDETFTYDGSFMEKFYQVNKDYGYFFKNARDLFGNDDLTVVNLETTLTNATKKRDKPIRFKGLPEFANILLQGNVDVVNISNNHINDYFKQGLEDTINSIKGAGIEYYGEGKAFAKTINQVKVCMLGYRVWELSDYTKKIVKRDIEFYKKKGYEVIIVSYHWGVEWVNYPTELQTELGRFSVDSGADLVVGHHPHVIQSIEKYKGKYIVYSLGNFCYGGMENPKDKDTFVFQQKFLIENGKISVNSVAKIIPFSMSSVKNRNDYKPTPAAGVDKTKIISRMNKYSKAFKVVIDNNGIIK